jgi:hypothetical protein
MKGTPLIAFLLFLCRVLRRRGGLRVRGVECGGFGCALLRRSDTGCRV